MAAGAAAGIGSWTWRWRRIGPARLVIEAAVDAAAPAGHVLWHLEQALAGDPAALVLGAPPAAGALAAELAARGSALAVPVCAACGRTGKPLFRGERGGVCQRCRAWQTAEPCAACGKAKPVAVRTAAGEPLCEMSGGGQAAHAGSAGLAARPPRSRCAAATGSPTSA